MEPLHRVLPTLNPASVLDFDPSDLQDTDEQSDSGRGPKSIPDWYKHYCNEFLSDEILEKMGIRDMIEEFDPVHALMAEDAIIKAVGSDQWEIVKRQDAKRWDSLFISYSNMVSRYMLAPERNKNLVFSNHAWTMHPTNKKMMNYMDSYGIGVKEPISLDVFKTLTSDMVSNIMDAKNIVAFKDGVLDMSCFEQGIRDGKPVDFVTTVISYKIKFSIDHVLQEELYGLLASIFPDQELREYFLYHMASCLDSGNLDKVFVIWHGVGNNGKSVMESLVENAFGSYCLKVPTSLFSSRRTGSSSATPETVSLNKSLVAFLQESDGREMMNIGVLKEMTGNDTIYTRGLFEAPKTIEVRCKFILVTNKVYNLSQADEATWSRIRVLPFLSTFTSDESAVDHEKNIFKNNSQYIRDVKILAPYFMRLIIEYYPKYKKNGLPKCSLVSANTNSLKRSNSSAFLFKEDMMIFSPECSMRFQEVYEAYRLYARNNCGMRNITAANFEIDLKKTGIDIIEGNVVGYCLADTSSVSSGGY
ncbi:hypothetical protein GGF37_000979 [Kickxella alabastrina]|nr:hypothetical protein GGF37_000979 [Kickxella alabastrina]